MRRTASYLNAAAVREIVAFDRERRAGREYDGRRYGSVTGGDAPRFVGDGTECFGVDPRDVREGIVRRKPTRKTLRYNYILHDGEGKGCDVIVLHVAVRLDRGDRPVVKDVGAFSTRTGTHMWRDIDCRRIAGWVVSWEDEDINGTAGGAWRIANGGAWRVSGEPWRYGQGRSFPRHETVNVAALKGTRFEYCQYADGTGNAGLIDWLMLYRDEPKVELLAKAGWHALITPMGIKALRDRAVFGYVQDHGDEVRKLSSSCWGSREIVYAARHGVPIREACRHFSLVADLRGHLGRVKAFVSERHYELHGSYFVPKGKGLRIDYARLERLLPRWRVDAAEYARYLGFAVRAGMDWRNEGTLYPPTGGGRAAFMGRLEAMERDYELRRSRARRERRRRYERLVAERAVEIDAFQRSLARTRTLAGAGYRIVLAKTQEELRAEGKRMCNCVGMGHYGEGIVLGDRLIVMLRHGNGRSYCDIEIDRRSWRVVQCYLSRNEAAPEEVQSLARRIAGALRSACARMRRKAGAKAGARKRSAA